MPIEFASFAFIISLAAVVNGLGIVRWLTGLAEYLRRKNSLNIRHYWVWNLFAGFQFMLHILLWWQFWGVRGAAEINFPIYVYLLAGPLLLYLGTSVLAPGIDDDHVDMRSHYFAVRATYSSVLALLWFWAIFLGLILRGEFAPTVLVLVLFLLVALIQRLAANPKIQGTLAALNWILLVVFISGYAMQLGGSAS